MSQPRMGINLNDLKILAKKNPKYAKLLGEIAGIDQLIKNIVNDTITNSTDPKVYFIKTELFNQCYNLYLFNSELNATVAHTWLFDDFLKKCQTKMIDIEVETVTKYMLKKFKEEKLSSDKINWTM